jgi:ribosomal protein L34
VRVARNWEHPHPNPHARERETEQSRNTKDPKTGIRSRTETKNGDRIMKKKRKGKIGSSFDAFLKEEGMYEDVEATAIKRILAWQIQKEMTHKALRA